MPGKMHTSAELCETIWKSLTAAQKTKIMSMHLASVLRRFRFASAQHGNFFCLCRRPFRLKYHLAMHQRTCAQWKAEARHRPLRWTPGQRLPTRRVMAQFLACSLEQKQLERHCKPTSTED